MSSVIDSPSNSVRSPSARNRRQTSDAAVDREAAVPSPQPSNPLRQLVQLGQSIWLDALSRDVLRSGQLQRLLENDGVTGVTSNPVTSQRTVSGGHTYAAEIQRLAREGRTVEQIRDGILIADIQATADVLRPIYERTQRRDGYVSVDLSPHLAHKTGETVAEALRLWKVVGRPNLMIKVPATPAGVGAVHELIADGINIHATMLFDLLRYREVLDAWISGLDERVRRSAQVDAVACVAGFSLSRMDALVDPLLEHAVAEHAGEPDRVWQLRGQVAVAQAKLAYVVWERFLAGFRFARLVDRGAQRLRLLWASTGRKNSDYSELKYVEPLIAADTIAAMPMDTLDAYREHGHPAARINEGLDNARGVLYELHKGDLELHEIARQLEEDGLLRLIQAHEGLLSFIRAECLKALRSDRSVDPDTVGRR